MSRNSHWTTLRVEIRLLEVTVRRTQSASAPHTSSLMSRHGDHVRVLSSGIRLKARSLKSPAGRLAVHARLAGQRCSQRQRQMVVPHLSKEFRDVRAHPYVLPLYLPSYLPCFQPDCPRRPLCIFLSFHGTNILSFPSSFLAVYLSSVQIRSEGTALPLCKNMRPMERWCIRRSTTYGTMAL